MTFVLPIPSAPGVAVNGGGEFPVRRIFCVGQNYAAHAREMGSDPKREEPFFFSKPADAVVASGSAIPYPTLTSNLHHEIELVVALGREGFEVEAQDATALVFGYAAGVDLTRRDLQNAAKAKGRPWDMSKGFDRSAPCAAITPGREPPQGAIALEVNGEVRQSSRLDDMIWSVPELISRLSRYVRLRPGDLVYTGTPEGVGPLQPGDRVLGRIDGLDEIAFTIAPGEGAAA